MVANPDLAGMPNRKKRPMKRRAQALFTVEVFEQIFDLPEGVRIQGVSVDNRRNIISFYLEGEGLPQTYECPEGQEPREVVTSINGAWNPTEHNHYLENIS